MLMRGAPDPQMAMLTTLWTEDLIPAEHPIRKIRAVVDIILAELDPVFDRMYASGGPVVSGHLLMENRNTLIVDAEPPSPTATPSGTLWR